MNKLTELWIKVTKETEIEEYHEDVRELYEYTRQLQTKVNQLESTLNEVRAIVSKSVFKTDLVELCRMKNQIKEVLDKVGGSNE